MQEAVSATDATVKCGDHGMPTLDLNKGEEGDLGDFPTKGADGGEDLVSRDEAKQPIVLLG